MELLFDATDIEQASLLVSVIPFNIEMVETLIDTFKAMSEKAKNIPD